MKGNKRIIISLLLFSLLVLTTSSYAQKKDTKEPCVTSAKGPILEGQPVAANNVIVPMARVGKKAPDFEAVAFQGDGFKKVKLSDYAGKWVVLCFYPGDFTFV